MLAAAALAVLGVALWMLVGRSSDSGKTNDRQGVSQALFQEETGVRVIRVAVTGGGGLVDLRYQVTDPDKAVVVHDDPLALVDEATGEVIDDLFMGHGSKGQPQAGLTYPVLFVNRQGLVKRGRTVSVLIGDSRLEHVTVQ